ncbi:phosphoribosylaminoimidazolesuccinocarboxamide synthase [Candidatus Saccharibacteria bacterium]|nr:phosphoribosylaminoimidazolesuccinocarboxamide synthase [Candidatus Saccharibacteria bacterium]
MRKIKSGKVRDIYEYESGYANELCFVVSDRVSAFDSVIPELKIEGKGRILTELSANWAEEIETWKNSEIETAYITFDDEQIEEIKKDGIDYRYAQSQLALEMIPIEAVVRGYLTGSLWEAYKNGAREICGLKLPDGLKESDKLPEPIFTPTTKAPAGEHDENIDFGQMVEIIADADLVRLPDYEYDVKGLAETLREWSLELYKRASDYAEKRGIIIADTKFEFGLGEDGRLYLGDEILTPDSSRFWPQEEYKPGRAQGSLDKQLIRDYVKEQKAKGAAIKGLPQDLIFKVQNAYEQILKTLFPPEY